MYKIFKDGKLFAFSARCPMTGRSETRVGFFDRASATFAAQHFEFPKPVCEQCREQQDIYGRCACVLQDDRSFDEDADYGCKEDNYWYGRE